MNLKLIKGGLQLLVGYGAGLITDHVIDIVKPQNLKGIKKIAVKVGGVAMSMMVADKVSDYVVETWDKTAEDIANFVKPKEEITEEPVEEAEEK